jgi:hypothetical protein
VHLRDEAHSTAHGKSLRRGHVTLGANELQVGRAAPDWRGQTTKNTRENVPGIEAQTLWSMSQILTFV